MTKQEKLPSLWDVIVQVLESDSHGPFARPGAGPTKCRRPRIKGRESREASRSGWMALRPSTEVRELSELFETEARLERAASVRSLNTEVA